MRQKHRYVGLPLYMQKKLPTRSFLPRYGKKGTSITRSFLPDPSAQQKTRRSVPSGHAAATSPHPRTAVQTLVYISLLEILLRLDSEDFGWIGLLPIKIIVGITTRCSILQEPHKQAFSHARSVSWALAVRDQTETWNWNLRYTSCPLKVEIFIISYNLKLRIEVTLVVVWW